MAQQHLSPLLRQRLVCARRRRSSSTQLHLHLSKRGVGGLPVLAAPRGLCCRAHPRVGGLSCRAVPRIQQVPTSGPQPLDVRCQHLHLGLGIRPLGKGQLVAQAVGQGPPHLRCHCLPGAVVTSRGWRAGRRLRRRCCRARRCCRQCGGGGALGQWPRLAIWARNFAFEAAASGRDVLLQGR